MSPDYMRVACRRWSLRNESGGMRTPEIRDLTRQMRSMSSVVQEDPDFIRIKYLRYADDWILGVIGPKELAVTLRNEVQGFLEFPTDSGQRLAVVLVVRPLVLARGDVTQ